MRKFGRVLVVVLSAALAVTGLAAGFTHMFPRVTQALEMQKNQIEKAAHESRTLIVPESGIRNYPR